MFRLLDTLHHVAVFLSDAVEALYSRLITAELAVAERAEQAAVTEHGKTLERIDARVLAARRAVEAAEDALERARVEAAFGYGAASQALQLRRERLGFSDAE